MPSPLGNDPELDGLLDSLANLPETEPTLFTQEWWTSQWGQRYSKGKNWPAYSKSWPEPIRRMAARQDQYNQSSTQVEAKNVPS